MPLKAKGNSNKDSDNEKAKLKKLETNNKIIELFRSYRTVNSIAKELDVTTRKVRNTISSQLSEAEIQEINSAIEAITRDDIVKKLESGYTKEEIVVELDVSLRYVNEVIKNKIADPEKVKEARANRRKTAKREAKEKTDKSEKVETKEIKGTKRQVVTDIVDISDDKAERKDTLKDAITRPSIHGSNIEYKDNSTDKDALVHVGDKVEHIKFGEGKVLDVKIEVKNKISKNKTNNDRFTVKFKDADRVLLYPDAIISGKVAVIKK